MEMETLGGQSPKMFVPQKKKVLNVSGSWSCLFGFLLSLVHLVLGNETMRKNRGKKQKQLENTLFAELL